MILRSYNISVLQALRHLLVEMRNDPVTALAEVEKELSERQRGKEQIAATSPPQLQAPTAMRCPHCDAPMRPGGRVESDFAEDAQLLRVGCVKCGYSQIVGEAR